MAQVLALSQVAPVKIPGAAPRQRLQGIPLGRNVLPHSVRIFTGTVFICALLLNWTTRETLSIQSIEPDAEAASRACVHRAGSSCRNLLASGAAETAAATVPLGEGCHGPSPVGLAYVAGGASCDGGEDMAGART